MAAVSAIVVGVSAQGAVVTPLVWGVVDDSQSPNWQVMDDSQVGGWVQVVDGNTVVWVREPTT